MTPIAPLWWFKEVPVQLEAFVDNQHGVKHIVPFPRQLQSSQIQDKNQRNLENQGGVFAFPDQNAKSVVWRTTENATELVLTSISGKENTPTRPISFQFHAPILPGIHFASLAPHGGITIVLLTVDSILYKLHISALSHFLTKDLPQGYSTATQIKWTSSNATPFLFRYLGDRLAAVSSLDGSLYLVKTALLAEDTNRHEHAEVKVFELRDDSHHVSRISDTTTIQKFRSIFHTGADHTNGFLEQNIRLDILAMESYTSHDDTLLFTLHQDRVVRVWSTGRRQCLQLMRIPLNPNDAGYVQETIGTSSRAHLGIMFNPLMPWVLRLLVYIPSETDAQLAIYSSRIDTIEDVRFIQGSINTIRPDSATGPGSNPANLIKIQIIPNENQTGYTIWGLWEGNMKISLKYILIDDPVAEREDFQQFVKRDLLDGRWWPVAMQTQLSGFVKSMSAVDDSVEDISKYYTEFIFTSGRFSDRTIMRALDTLFDDQTFKLKPDLQNQVVQAMSAQSLNSSQDSENKRHQEIMNWTRFISYCAKLDYIASAPLGLSIALNTGYMIIIKQDALSFITACDDSEILYHTFHDKQFEVAQFIATPLSQLRSIYPKLQDPMVRNDVSKIFKAIGYLTQHLTVESSKNLESVIAHLSKTNGPRNFVDIFMQEHLTRIIPKTDMNRARNMVTSCKASTDIFQFINSQLLYSADSGPARATSERCILPYEALVASSIQQLSSSRYSLSQNLLILLCVCFSAPASSRTWIQDETECISDVLRITQILLVLKWISNRSISSTPPLPSELEQKLSQMQVHDSLADSENSFRQSLTGYLLKTMSSKINKYGTAEFPIFFAIPRAVSTFLHILGIMNQGQDVISKYHVGLAQRLSSRGEMELLSQFLEIVPTNSALPYYRGKVLLSQQNPEKALEQFLAVTASFGNDIGYIEQELDIMQQDYTTGTIIGHAKLEDYYNNIISLFAECNAHEQVIAVSKLALSSIARNPKSPGSEVQVRILLERTINSSLAISSYERAFNAMMLIQNENIKKQFLKKFISKICENGDGAKLALFAFGGLQDDIERILKTNAEKCPVLLKPDNYQILYAYYTYKGEYKKGATIMYQYAKRLCNGKNKSEPIWRLLSEAGSSLLAAINALYLVGPGNAWVSVPSNDTDQTFDEPSKRRRLSSTTAKDLFVQSSNDVRENTPHRVDVVHLSDLKQEFALINAKLRLVTNVPSQLLPGVLSMTARETQLLLVHCGFHDEATSLALKFNLDLGAILSALVERYLMALSIEQEEFLRLGGLQGPNNTHINNSKSSTSLQVLQSYLKLHDNVSSNYKYRLVVIESILTINPNFDLQPWLTQHYLKHNPEDLIRVYLKFGALEKAARFASAVISSAIKKDELISRHSNARWLPYSLLDEIFEELNEQIAQTHDQLPKNHTPGSQRSKLEQHLQGLEKLKSQLDEDVRLYLENVERESIF